MGRGYRRYGSKPRRTSMPMPSRTAVGDTVTTEFSTVQEVLDFISHVPSSNYSVSANHERRFCSFSYHDTIKMVRSGWAEGVRDVAFNTDKINSALDEASGYAIEYDTAGDYIDMGAYLEGVPECFGKITSAEGPKESVRIVASITASSIVHEDHIKNRGAAICALIDQLRKTHFVSLDITVSSRGIMGKNLRTIFHVDMQNDYSRDLIAFYLAHPGMLRRVWFAIAEIALGYKNCVTYGHPHDDPLVPGAINFPSLSSGNWSSIETSTREVQGILDKFLNNQK